MAYRSLNHFIEALESGGHLLRIREFVNPRLEITEVADRMVKAGGKALLFENTGTGFPLLINALASDDRICLAFGIDDLHQIDTQIAALFAELTEPRTRLIDKLKVLPALKTVASWMPAHSSRRGECQEVVMDVPDLRRLPVLTCWPFDGGPFITLPGVHTKDPLTGIRNLGMYRMQVFGPEMTGMHWHLHKGSANHYRKYKELNRRMPVTVTLGGDPAYIYAATAPLPENIDEYLLAGFLRKKKVQLVKCLTNDLEVPADVDFVIEGYVDPSEEWILEGPFGDHTGFYSLADYFPRFHVTCISHRRNAVYPATIVGVPPQEDGWIGKATERIFLTPIKLTVAPEVTDMHMPVEGVFHNITLVSLHKQYQGQGIKIMNAMWGAGQMMFNKIMAVFDAGTDLQDYTGLARQISMFCDPLNDIHFIRGPVDILDHASQRYGYGSKIGIDATRKLPEETDNKVPGNPEETGSDSPASGTSDLSIVKNDKITEAFPEISSIHSGLIANGISLIFIALKKTRQNQVREVLTKILNQTLITGVKFIVVTDASHDLTNYTVLTWIVANNIDPMRDCFYVDDQDGNRLPVLCIDGTSKQSVTDRFNRDWPNVITMDDATICSVDDKWEHLGLGPFIPSPSIKIRHLVTGPGAVSSPV